MGLLSLNDIRAALAELLGMMFFVFVGTGSVVAAKIFEMEPGAALITISLAHGIGIVVAIAWTAGISGGHMNPVVSLAFVITGHVKPLIGALYIVAQCVGAILGSLLLLWATPFALEGADFGNLGAHGLGAGANAGEGFLLEALLTGFLLLVIYNVVRNRRGGMHMHAPLAIGLAVLIIHLAGVPFTGASVNPARSLGPAVVAGVWDDFWIYIVAPTVGAVAVAVIWWVWRRLGDDLEEEAEAA